MEGTSRDKCRDFGGIFFSFEKKLEIRHLCEKKKRQATIAKQSNDLERSLLQEQY